MLPSSLISCLNFSFTYQSNADTGWVAFHKLIFQRKGFQTYTHSHTMIYRTIDSLLLQ